jgi:hypothetical protein
VGQMGGGWRVQLSHFFKIVGQGSSKEVRH